MNICGLPVACFGLLSGLLFILCVYVLEHMLYVFNKRFIFILHTNSDFSFGMSKNFITITGFTMAQSTTYNFDVYQPRNPSKRRQFCPSCHQKRVIEHGEWLLVNVLKDVPHRQWIFSIPKRLRIYFLFDRKLLAKLSICAWKVIKAYLKSSAPDDSAVPGASIAVQTYGDFSNFNPHLHAIVSDGCFFKGNDFHMDPGFILEDLEEIFQYEVLKMLKKEGKITDVIIENMLSWRHSGFHVYIGDRIFSDSQIPAVDYWN